MEKKYSSKNHGCFMLMAHFVFVCKYRSPILHPDLGIDEQMKNIMQEIANEKNFKIIEQGTDTDHMHLLISYDPDTSILSLVKLIKQMSTFRIWRQQDNHLKLEKHLKTEKTFWTDGYFVCSIGESSKDAIEKYIQSQGIK